MVEPLDSAEHEVLQYSCGVFIFFCTEKMMQCHIDSRDPVPFQGFEEFPDRVIAVLVGDNADGPVDLFVVGQFIDLLQPDDDVIKIGVSKAGITVPLPGNGSLNTYPFR